MFFFVGGEGGGWGCDGWIGFDLLDLKSMSTDLTGCWGIGDS